MGLWRKTIDMIIYIEKFNKYEGVLLADFITVNDFNLFCNSIDMPSDHRTMLYIVGLNFKSGISPKEGCIYKIPDELRFGFEWYREDESASDIIAFTAKPKKKYEQSFFSRAIKRTRKTGTQSKVELGNWDGIPCGGSNISGEVKIRIKNVGQGNWNEIYVNKKCKIIYDLGVSIKLNQSDVRKIVGNSTSFEHNPSLIISHWDIDHYKAIFQVEPHRLSSLCCSFFPSIVPNLTSSRACKILLENCSYNVGVKESNSRKKKRRISLEIIYRQVNFMLLKGEKSSDRNKSGISMALWNEDNCTILGGDQHYYQIFDDILKELPSRVKLNIVTPHHGGEAVSLKKFIKKVNNVGRAVTSTGPNNYGHPRESNRKDLSEMGFDWERTDLVKNDIDIIL